MAKPIAIIYFPDNWVDNMGERNWIYEYMAYLNGELRESDIRKWPESKGYWKDYYWFCFYNHDITAPNIIVYHEKDFTDIQYKELEKLIFKNIEEIKQHQNVTN